MTPVDNNLNKEQEKSLEKNHNLGNDSIDKNIKNNITETPCSENDQEKLIISKTNKSPKNEEVVINVPKTNKNLGENKISDKDLEASDYKINDIEQETKQKDQIENDKDSNNINKINESELNNNIQNSETNKEAKKSETSLKLIENEFIDKQEKMPLEISVNNEKNVKLKLDKVEYVENETNSNKKTRNHKANNTSKNGSLILNTYNYPENNNVEIENEEADIQININDNDISNINKEKIIERHEISESSGAVVKLFTGEKNEIIEILNERLTEKEKQNKILILEIEKLKSKLKLFFKIC